MPRRLRRDRPCRGHHSKAATNAVREEWPASGVVEIDQRLAEHAAAVALERDVRSLDALHLTAALVLPRADLESAIWDARLRAAAAAEGLELLARSHD